MTVDSALSGAKEKMAKAIAVLKDELSGIRTGRASPALLTRMVVEYYGTPVPIQQLASFSVPEPRMLLIQPYDPNAISAMEKERRKELIKLVHQRGEEGRVAVRNIRRHSKEELERLERERAISEDDLVRSEKELQKLTDHHVAEVDEIVVHKEQELKEI